MKSSRSSSQLTDGGAAGGVVWLDEPLGFPFLSFLDLRSCTGGGTSCVGGHGLGGMKSSMSSSQLTQVCAAGGATWLDEPLDFPFVSFLILGSCTGGEHHVLEAMVWGHEVIHVVIPVNTSWWLRCCSMTQRTSGHLFLRRSSSLRHKSTEDTYQFTEIWYRFINQLRVLGVILTYN